MSDIIQCDNCGLTGEIGVTWYNHCINCDPIEVEPSYTVVSEAPERRVSGLNENTL